MNLPVAMLEGYSPHAPGEIDVDAIVDFGGDGDHGAYAISGYGDDGSGSDPQADAATRAWALNATMDTVILGLHNALSTFQSTVSGKLLVSDTVKANYLGTSQTWNNIITRLDGPSRAEVVAGTMDPMKWLKSAQVVKDGLQDLGSSIQGDSLFVYLDQTFAQASADFSATMGAFAATVSAVASAAKWWVPALALGAGYIAYRIWVAPITSRIHLSEAPSMGNYRHKKRRRKNYQRRSR